MKPIELRTIILEMYGKEYGSGRKLSHDIGVGEITISRWLNGARPISKSMAVLIRLIHYLDANNIQWRNYV